MTQEQTAFLFQKVRKYLSKHHSFLKSIQLKIGCKLAEEARSDPRVFAHTLHIEDTVCISKDMLDLPVEIQGGLLLHEFGHIIADKITGDGSQQAADIAVASLGFDLTYTDDELELEIIPEEQIQKILKA